MSIAALTLTACAEEDATLAADGGKLGDAGGATGAVRDGGTDAGLGGIDAAVAAKLPVENGDWTVFEQDGGVANPAENIEGTVLAEAIDGGMRVSIDVQGLAPEVRKYGTHLHQKACSDALGGPHYQNNPAPADAGTDPAFANATNEVWLDFETDAEGNGSSATTVKWVPRKGGAKSVVVHERATGDGGLAGGRLACTELDFDK